MNVVYYKARICQLFKKNWHAWTIMSLILIDNIPLRQSDAHFGLQKMQNKIISLYIYTQRTVVFMINSFSKRSILKYKYFFYVKWYIRHLLKVELWRYMLEILFLENVGKTRFCEISIYFSILLRNRLLLIKLYFFLRKAFWFRTYNKKSIFFFKKSICFTNWNFDELCHLKNI